MLLESLNIPLRISFLLTYRLTVKLFTLCAESGLGLHAVSFGSRAWAFCPGLFYQDCPRVSTWNGQLYKQTNTSLHEEMFYDFISKLEMGRDFILL